MFINEKGEYINKIMLCFDAREEIERYDLIINQKIDTSSFFYSKHINTLTLLNYGLPYLFWDLTKDKGFLDVLRKADYFQEIFSRYLNKDQELFTFDHLHNEVTIRPTFRNEVNLLIKEIGIRLYNLILKVDFITPDSFFNYARLLGSTIYFTAQTEGVDYIC